ncbi:MAG: hypothetical protein ABSE67_16795, partial [Xanthobacteraceae bacterium]
MSYATDLTCGDSVFRFGSFRHLEEEDYDGHEGGGAQGEKCRAVAEMIDNLASGKPAKRSAYPLHRGD